LKYEVFGSDWKVVRREIVSNEVSLSDVSKNGFETFMLKEISEEALVIDRTFNNFECKIDLRKYKNVSIIACGTSYYAGLLAKYWIEDISKIHTDVEIASEFRYRNPVMSKDTIYIFISQSGETIDTLSAMRLVKSHGLDTLAFVNVDNSSIAREADIVVKTLAGTEIGVASTKAFVAQAMSILLLSIDKSTINIDEIIEGINTILNDQYKIKNLVKKIKDSKSLFYIGRGTSYPIALEGSLKMKELSYISAEGYPSGEIKHGPIAIIDENVYTIALAPLDKYFEKTLSNTQEILARNGQVLIITSKYAEDSLKNIIYDNKVDVFYIPDGKDIYNPFFMTTAVHLLAYYTSKLKGYDVDKPRNLAKSVTVE
jgi:glucosamine--fructose-6-phosphate aminotransferase (isomerizing)